jgi:acyl-coenzyme A synthetase/AMP-(fatty) acid ligase
MRIEEILSKNESIRDCAVVGVKDELFAYRTVAYIIISDRDTDEDAIRAQLDDYCRQNLPDSRWPDEYIFVDEFPVTRAGKVDYKTLESKTT